MFSGRAKVTGIIGWPVSQSLSPAMHNYWLDYYNIDGVYIPLPIEDELEKIVRLLPKMGIKGFNVTIPYKEQILPLLDSLDDGAKAIGAVNTVAINHEGKLQGMNTDVYGFWRNLEPHVRGKKKDKVVILGAGGAAKAICHSLISENYIDIAITNRTEERARDIATHFGGRLAVHAWDSRDELLEGADLLINTTSLGMTGKAPLQISLDALPKEAVVNDIVYSPLYTELLTTARERGHTVVDGLGMLIHQAIHGFRSWYGMKPDVTPELREILLKELEGA